MKITRSLSLCLVDGTRFSHRLSSALLTYFFIYLEEWGRQEDGGGKDKGGSIKGFAKQIVPHLKQAILIGETRFSVKRELESLGLVTREVASLEEAVNLVLELGRSGDDALLSPGFASFDMFESYAKRGEAFREAIGHLDSERNVLYG